MRYLSVFNNPGSFLDWILSLVPLTLVNFEYIISMKCLLYLCYPQCRR